MSFFDECYQSYKREFISPVGWRSFWEQELKSLEAVNIDPQITKKISNKLLTEINYHLKFTSSNNFEITSQFVAPRLLTRKPPLLVIFNNYLDQPLILKALSQAGIAQFIIRLRGHEIPIQELPEENQKDTYGYFQNRLLDKDQYYYKYLLLDAYRSWEVILSRSDFDNSKVAVWGLGTGALMALFLTAFAKRKPDALFLSHPDFCDIALTQAVSKTSAFQEINSTIKKTYSSNKANINTIKNNLLFFDTMNFIEHITMPISVLTNIGNKDEAPQGAFSFFHKINSEKQMCLQTEYDILNPKAEFGNELESVVSFFTKVFQLKSK